MDKRYQVFISSTFEDLKEERQAVLKAVLELDHMPAGMELFPASDDIAWRLICDVIDTSDYYVLIVGGRYGSLDETGISYTEKEYDYALSKKKPVISLLHADPDNLPRAKTETDAKAWQKLQTFRAKVEKNHTCVYWSTPPDLKVQVILGLTAAVKRHPTQGWVRAGTLASEEASREIIRLQKTVDGQREELARLASTPPEGAEKLAQGKDSFTLDFRVTLIKDNAQWTDPKRMIRRKCSTVVTWDEVFGAFAPRLVNPTPEPRMRADIARFLFEKVSNGPEAEHAGYTASYCSITQSLFQTIKVQFLALGLIDSSLQPRATEGTKRQEPVCTVTPLGKRHLVKVKARYRD